jgi:hypothetical protein
MTRTFSAYCGLVLLFLASCGLLVTVTSCSGTIRASIVSIVMCAVAAMYLKQANEKPIGVWVNLYRSGMAIAIVIAFVAISRIVFSLQRLGC